MKQKLQELLSEKFKGTRKDTLARLATAYSLQCTTEEEAQALVEKLQLNQVTEFEKEYRSEVDSEISKAVNTAKNKGKEGEGNPSAGEENKTDPTEAPLSGFQQISQQKPYKLGESGMIYSKS